MVGSALGVFVGVSEDWPLDRMMVNVGCVDGCILGIFDGVLVGFTVAIGLLSETQLIKRWIGGWRH